MFTWEVFEECVLICLLICFILTERQLYDLKAWKQESLQQQKKDHDSQIINFKRQLAIFMKILRYNPSGEIYEAENNLEALRLQHLQNSIISH